MLYVVFADSAIVSTSLMNSPLFHLRNNNFRLVISFDMHQTTHTKNVCSSYYRIPCHKYVCVHTTMFMKGIDNEDNGIHSIYVCVL